MGSESSGPSVVSSLPCGDRGLCECGLLRLALSVSSAKSCLCRRWSVGLVTSRNRSFHIVTYLVFICIPNVHLLRLPFALPFFQFLPELFHLLPLIGRPVLVSVIQRGPAKECFVGSNSYTEQRETLLLVTSHKSILVPGRT